MSRLNSDGHDESQYLPKGTPPVNPFRAQHCGIKWSGKAIRAIDWLPDALYERGLMEKAHLDTTCCFYRALISTRKTLGISDILGSISERFPIAGNQTIIDIFFPVMTELSKPQSTLLLWLVEEKNSEGNIMAAFRLAQNILATLEQTQNIIDRLSGIDKMHPIHLSEVSLK